ncbi:ATPase [Sphingomonas sp.]|uniref:ATPase n=1 Tax=Sphingomonas sp. TaxID=28214 RepID=UPI00286E5F84|nr:ATPase [Sphingomonas sp.]
MIRWFCAAAAMALIAAPASAEVVASSTNGLHIRHGVELAVPAADAYRAFTDVGGWWNLAHSYSGQAANLTLTPRAGGCLCERLPDGGGIEHLHVTMVQPGKQIVLTGALGPLLFQAATGVMTVKFERLGGGSKVTLDYRVAGFATGNADKLAAPVDQVLGEQLKRFGAFAAKPPGT